MNFIAQVEEHLRDLGAEARKKHPGVKEASERAILQLRALQNAYVTAVRMATQSGGVHPTTELFRSQDILRPFLLAANYPNASPQLLQISLSAMSLLIEGNAICPGDGMHMVRVWTIQAQVHVGALRKQHSTSNTTSTTGSSSSWFGGMLSSSDLSSSSAGQGGGAPPKKESEKVALELLSLLIQLLELRDLPVTDEQWASSVALCCILLETEKSNTVQQAANSTLHQVLGLMFENESKIAVETWQDLVTLASSLSESTLVGAFSHCTGSGPSPPSPQVCLELMHKLLSQEDLLWLSRSRALMDPTLELTRLQFSKKEESLETLWRSCQLARVLLQKNPREDLIATLIQGIVAATEACRKNHDFEDGFIYMGHIVRKPSQKILTLVPDFLLWKAGLALETLLVVLPFLGDNVSVVAEAISDFCTICASCQDHMLQLVECASANEQTEPDCIQMDPQIFRNAEEALKTSEKTTCSMGEALWIAFHIILRLIQNFGAKSMDGCFAPSLAVFQHYLKRFPGSSTMVQCTLEGYRVLADAVVPGRALLRQALLASLCKLSLPSWGKHDSSCQLDAHHVETLMCLLKIVHKHYDTILSDWRMVLWTFQELSILSISSPLLSDEGYSKALAISSTFARIAPLSACLSPKSLTCIIDGLVDISTSWLEMRDGLMGEDSALRMVEIAKPRADSVDVKTHRKTSSTVKAGDSTDPKSSLSGKLMSFAGRTLLGGQLHESIEDDFAPLPVVAERTKNTYFGSYRQDFLRRLHSSKRTLRNDVVGKLPFSLVALTDVSMANTYRYDTCGTMISSHLCSLAATSPDIRAYAMDILAMLVASQLSDDSPVPSSFSGPGRISIERPMKNQFLVVEALAVDDSTPDVQGDATDPGHSQSMSQTDLVAPLCETIRTAQSHELAEAGISALHSILEGAGHNMTDGVWTVLIVAIASLSGDVSKAEEDGLDRSGSEWATCCMLAFRCLKLVVDDFLDQIPLSYAPLTPRAALLDGCSSFGSSCHDVNISLTAIGLLWSIADQDSNSWSIDRALTELVALSSDNRTEVRNCAVNTLFSCIVGRGQGFTGEQWEVCICRTIFSVYDRVYDRVLSRGESGGEEFLETSVTTGGGKKSKSASDRYKVSVHHSRDSAGKQWMTSQVMVLQGLSRVLRNFFPQLLDTMDSPIDGDINVDHDPVWFPKAWTRILDVALNAARQPGSRETLDLRAVGVELLAQCCQLTCRAGTQAAITPARVGTNMEVVNGALKHVDKNPHKASEKEIHHQISAKVNQWREVFFLAAFDALDAYRDFLEQEVLYDTTLEKSPFVETTQVQVLYRLALGLGKLYECCKNDEFAPEQAPHVGSQRQESRIQRHLELKGEMELHQDNLEGRFVNLVAMLARTATGDPVARFLSQAQRAALELLRSMSSQSSDEAIRVLASMGGDSFFWIGRTDDGNDDVDDENSYGSELVRHEAAKAVTAEISKGTIADETKVQVLYQILSVFAEGLDETGQVRKKRGEKRCFTLLVPIFESGVGSAARIEESLKLSSDDGDSDADASSEEESNSGEADQVKGAKGFDRLWDKVAVVLTQMLSPVRSQSHGSYISHAASLLEILEAVVLHVTPTQHVSICPVLSTGAFTSIEVARLQSTISNDDSKTAETRRKAMTRREEALKIFEACFNGMCSLQSHGPSLHDLTKNVLEGVALSDSNADDKELSTDVAVIVCQVIARNAEMERLVIRVFSLLCRCMSIDDQGLRNQAGNLLGRIDVGKVLETTTRKCELAEERAQEAEEHIQELMDEIEDLREENDSLQQQILVYAASSSLT